MMVDPPAKNDRTGSTFDDAEPSAAEQLLVSWPGGSLVIALRSKGVVVLGRSSDCDVRIEHSSVSRRHARLRTGQVISIEDLGSSHGTFVNGKRLPAGESVELATGQRVDIGAATLIVHRPVPAPARDAQSAEMAELGRLIDLVARGDISVLLHGETGAGKDVTAARIHAASPRRDKPFLRLNCAALPDNLLESELFGYERGAFTGAAQAKHGLLETASGGTVLLDEIGEIPGTTQAKLLRALENREVWRVGALKPTTIDVRFIAATNRDLAARVAAGAFREDLFYRLSGATLRVPPLRERVVEIAPLAERFAVEASFRLGRPPPALSPRFLAALEAHAWPGNVRELRNAVERAVLLLGPGTMLEPTHLQLNGFSSPPSTSRFGEGTPTLAPPAISPRTIPSVAPSGGLRDELDAIEQERIRAALDRCGGNQTRAALELGMPRRTLVKRLQQYGVPRPRKPDG